MKVRYTIYNENCLPVFDVVIPHVDCVYYQKNSIEIYLEDGNLDTFPLKGLDFTLEVFR